MMRHNLISECCRSGFTLLVRSALLITLLFAGQVFAQREGDVYGMTVLGTRWLSNVTPARGSVTKVDGNADGLGFIGFRKSEWMENGWRANIVLEAAFAADTGAASTRSFFNQQATVGLQGSWGQLSFGHQYAYAGAAGAIWVADAVAGYLETSWLSMYTGNRFSNSLQYQGQFGQVTAGALVALGETSGALPGRTWALSTTYAAEAFPGSVRFAYQRSHDLQGKVANIGVLGATFAPLPGLSLSGAFLSGDYERGFLARLKTDGSQSPGSIGMGFQLADDMRVRGLVLGAIYRDSSPWTYRLSFHQALSTGAVFLSDRGDGAQRLILVQAAYALSPRTALVLGADFNNWTGRWGRYFGSGVESNTSAALNGSNTRLGLSFALRHRF